MFYTVKKYLYPLSLFAFTCISISSCSDNDEVLVASKKNFPPIAKISVETKSINSITLNASKSYDPDGEVVLYKWNILEKDKIISTDMPILKLKEKEEEIEAGDYTVSLIVEDNLGRSSLSELSPMVEIKVPTYHNTAPIVEDISISLNSNLDKVSGMFKGRDLDGDIINFEIVSSPLKGEIIQKRNLFIYTPFLDFKGKDTVEYIANDGKEKSNIGKIFLTE